MTVHELPIVRTISALDPATLDDPVGAPALPPAEFFLPPPDLADDAKITVDFETGRVYGRVAPRKQCLLSRPGECWTISDSPTGYKGAMQGETVLDDGRVIATANIGGTVRHASREASFSEAVDWYENTASRLMRVRFGADEHGIWLAGALLPQVTKRQALDIMQSPVSGDWRWRQELDAYDMTGVVLVNMPGFPLGVKARAAAAWHEPLIGTWMEVEAMVASLDASDATVSDVPGTSNAATAATFTADQRKSLAKSGAAMKDGSFPIRNRSDLHNAIQAFGRAKNKTAAKAHIIKRARALGLTSMLPEDWRGSTKAASAATCTCGTQVASPTGDDMPDELDEPEYVTREEAEQMAKAAAEAAVAALEPRLTGLEGNVGALTAAELERLDAALSDDEGAIV